MADSWIDRLSRTLQDDSNRRDLLRRLAATALGAATLGSAATPETAGAELAAAGKGKGKAKKCQRQGRQCGEDVAAFCAFYYPAQYALCRRDLNRCCGYASKCANAKAQLCLRSSGW